MPQKAWRPQRPRSHPEADIQRDVVETLRLVLPPRSIVHHSANERRSKAEQAILVGMGVHAGFSDLIVISAGRVLYLEVKSKTGSLTDDQKRFRDDVQAQGFPWALVRSVQDALDALRKFGFPTRIKG